MILRCDGAWDVNLPKPAADKLPADWDKWESKTMAVIGLAVEDSHLIHLLTLTSACELWMELQEVVAAVLCGFSESYSTLGMALDG
jgi:hypothetical protein